MDIRKKSVFLPPENIKDKKKFKLEVYYVFDI